MKPLSLITCPLLFVLIAGLVVHVSKTTAAPRSDDPSLAFHADPDGVNDLYLLDLRTGSTRPLTRDLEVIASAVWSPDGTELAFVARPQGTAQVFTVDANGHSLRQLTEFGGDSRNVAWTPDGREISFACCGESSHRLFLVHPDGTQRRLITSDGDHGVWSPDGKTLAFLRFKDGNLDIYTTGRDGDTAHRVTTAKGEDADPVWSPNGRQIAFDSARTGRSQIYVIDLRTSRTQRLSHDRWVDQEPHWSPNGRIIVYTSYRNRDPNLRGIGNADVVTVGIDGSNERNLTKTPNAWEGDPAWSPDGHQIAYATRRNFGRTGTFQLGLMAADGSAKRLLTRTRTSTGDPANSCCATWKP